MYPLHALAVALVLVQFGSLVRLVSCPNYDIKFSGHFMEPLSYWFRPRHLPVTTVYFFIELEPSRSFSLLTQISIQVISYCALCNCNIDIVAVAIPSVIMDISQLLSVFIS